MKWFADVKRRLVVGAVLECVENTYRPDVNGERRKVVHVQTNSVAFQRPMPDGSFLSGIPPRSQWYWLAYPANGAKGVSIIDADTFRMGIFPGQPGQHSVTLRFLPSDEVSA